MKDEVLEFIQRRFKNDCRWVDGNCYYFSIILKDRFPEGKIFYDITYGHFVFKYHNEFYDWTGAVSPQGCLIEWESFDKYDSLLRQRIVRDCVL